MATSGGQYPASVTPADTVTPPASAPVDSFTQVFTSQTNNWQRAASSYGFIDGSNTAAMFGVTQWAYVGGAAWDRLRTPNVFKNLSAAAVGAEATIWTPAAGKKFRLMGVFLDQGTATGAVTLRDNTGGSTILILPAEPINTNTGVFLGNGILSAAANNVLTAQGVATETLTGFVYGTEE